jgi:hypothetical protein
VSEKRHSYRLTDVRLRGYTVTSLLPRPDYRSRGECSNTCHNSTPCCQILLSFVCGEQSCSQDAPDLASTFRSFLRDIVVPHFQNQRVQGDAHYKFERVARG